MSQDLKPEQKQSPQAENSEVAGQPGLTMAVLGSSQFTLGFELVGIKNATRVDGINAEARLEAVNETMHDKSVGVLIVEGEALEGIGAYERTQLENSIKPVVVVLYRKAGETGELRRQIMRAIGVDLYAHDEDSK